MARTFVQGPTLLEAFKVDKPTKDAAITVLMDLQRHLLRCHEVCEGIDIIVRREREQHGVVKQPQHQMTRLPSVPDIQSRAESFLQSGKLAIAQTGNLLKVFYKDVKKANRDISGHNYNDLANWAENKFGVDDVLSKMLRDIEPWVKTIITMRDAVDHPGGTAGTLTTKNFTIGDTPAGPVLVEPTWSFDSANDYDILGEMKDIIEGTLELGEAVLVHMFEKHKRIPQMHICEIPVLDRKPDCPVRFALSLPQEVWR
ncbi:MAG: hypothetical protein AB7Q00_05545 [Phycisphaerales bacterium]